MIPILARAFQLLPFSSCTSSLFLVSIERRRGQCFCSISAKSPNNSAASFFHCLDLCLKDAGAFLESFMLPARQSQGHILILGHYCCKTGERTAAIKHFKQAAAIPDSLNATVVAAIETACCLMEEQSEDALPLALEELNRHGVLDPVARSLLNQ